MRELTVVYKWENGKEGSFTHPQFPEPQDMGLDPENVQHSSVYWGWFRQVLVTWRADAKRLREGNKSTAALSAEETARVMAARKVPMYAEPSESKDIVTKVTDAIASFTPAQIEALRAQLGITVHTS